MLTAVALMQVVSVINPDAKLINVSAPSQVLYKGEDLAPTVLRAKPGICAEVKLTIDGKSRTEKNVSFPHTFAVKPGDPIYPAKGGKYELVVEATAGCIGKLSYTFAYNDSDQGVVTDIVMNNFGGSTPDAASATIQGHGLCRLRVATWRAPYDPKVNATPYELIFYDVPTRLPITVPLKRSGSIGAQMGGDQVIQLYTIGAKADGLGTPDDTSKKTYPSWAGCVFKTPFGPSAWQAMKTYSAPKAGTAAGGQAGGGTPGGAPGGGGGIPSAPKPANGSLASMLVPGGSFAEDETQKFQVNGKGACGFDLVISNKTYGGSTEKTWPVLPVRLDTGGLLYNGTHFGTIAEGSWKATATGKNGCTGTAIIDFKVTPKTSTKKIAGQPTITFDQPPKNGSVFTKSKDSNIWFKVSVPQAVKDEPYATCCDVEFDFMNEYGGWEAVAGGPFGDSSYALAVKQANAVAFRSVSYFSGGTQWRVKMRASKYKTEFDWSDWLEFKVDQN